MLHRHDPALAKTLVSEVVTRGEAISSNFEGSGWAANVIGKPLMRGQVTVAMAVQDAADHLAIPIDDNLRIGMLPYLDR